MMNLRHGIEYLFVLLFFGLVKITPLSFTTSLASLLGKLAFLLTPKRVNIALDNLSSVFPNRTPTELRQVVAGLYRNLAGNAVDVVKPVRTVKMVTVSEKNRHRLEEIRKITSSGKPLIFVTGHYGAWEVLGQYLATQFAGIHFLALEQKNRYVDRLLNRKRISLGGKIIPSQRAPRLLSHLFRGGNIFLFAGDQDGGTNGIIVDFLGRPSSYARGLALYSYHYDAPVVPLFLKRENPGYTLDIAATIKPDLSADKKTEIKRIIACYSEALAQKVRECPSQWLWTHRRWKSTRRQL
ncbi:MAG: lysophospholipid acyltransferase family protein [candidate division Zixibacteria bacterium]|nr:lysophospholipid acyltransferase family protein [candidate division Zixibacteria bacterium]